MESGNRASSEGRLIPVPASSDVFQKSILTPLQSAYLYEESKQFFKYSSAVLIKNPALEKKYNAFRTKRREVGYSEEDLNESFGFLLFDDIDKANELGDTGLPTGNSTCTTLGDPSKGVYISTYSDCLDLNRWYHGKSGHIAIIRLTKGKVKKVSENYTQNFTAPTVGFDCHVSEQLPSVSSQTSSFLAFERTQCYVYELHDDGRSETAQCPSAACPYAIVSFSYTDTKADVEEPQKKSEEKTQVHHYLPWTGQIQIGSQFYNVELKSSSGALIPTKLPPVVKVHQAISMVNLRHLLPRASFETCFSGEAFLDGLYCSLCEFVPSEADDSISLSFLLCEIKDKDLALIIPLNDGGFLILLHSCHFLKYDDGGSCATEVLQGMFVFPDSRVIMADTKFGQKKAGVTSEIVKVLPLLSYAEGEIEKTPTDTSEELCEAVVQHMQRYTALINPGMASPSREVSIFPYQYDVPDGHKHLYSSTEWTNQSMQRFGSYLSKPDSFQLALSKASEILAAEQEERREDLDDDVYICISSPEEASTNHLNMESEDHLSDQASPVHAEMSVDCCTVRAEADSPAVSQNVSKNLQNGNVTKDAEKYDISEFTKLVDMGTKNLCPPTSVDLPAELIVSITSAEQSVAEKTLSLVNTISTTKQNDSQFSGFSTLAKLQVADVNSLSDGYTKTVLDIHEVSSSGKLLRGLSKQGKNASETGVDTPGRGLSKQDDEHCIESSDNMELNHLSKTDWRKLPRPKRKYGKSLLKTKKLSNTNIGIAIENEKKLQPGQESLQSTILMELETYPLRKKIERWDIKPVVSECGRILVPHGSVDIADQIISLNNKLQSAKDEHCSEKDLFETHINDHYTGEMEQEASIVPQAAVDETQATASMEAENHLDNITISQVNPAQDILKDSDSSGNGAVELNAESNMRSSKTDATDSLTSEEILAKEADTFSPGKPTKGGFLFSKLKSVLLKGKRKIDPPVTEEATQNTTQDTELCLKKSKVDSDAEALKYSDASTQDVNVGIKEASQLLPVDPVFVQALGLTPKEIPENVQKHEDQHTQQRPDSTETQKQTFVDKQPKIIQKPPSIFTRRGRIKTLKKHQAIPIEYVKQKCTPLQISPISDSAELLHHQALYGNLTLDPPVGSEDKGGLDDRTPECLKKPVTRRKKFRSIRTFVIKEGSIEITRQWQEKYNFSLDSKFTSESKEKTIIRALHGPRDFSIRDTNEEMRLIVHMWIGLFYSRSTARFFQVDSNFTHLCSEESDSLETASGMISESKAELKGSADACILKPADTSEPLSSDALDLRKKDTAVVDKESKVLDLSVKTPNEETVASDQQSKCVRSVHKEDSKTLDSLKSPPEQYQMVHTTIVSDVNDVGHISKSKKTVSTSQEVVCLEHPDVTSFKVDGTLIPPHQVMVNVVAVSVPVQTALGIDQVLHVSNKESTDKKGGTADSPTMKMSLLQKEGSDLSKSATGTTIDSRKKINDCSQSEMHGKNKSKDKTMYEEHGIAWQEGIITCSTKVVNTGNDAANKESEILSQGNYSANDKLLGDDAKAAGVKHFKGTVDCFRKHEDTVLKDNDHVRKDGLHDEGSGIAAVQADKHLGKKVLPVICNGPDLLQEICITMSSHQAEVNEQLSVAEGAKDAFHILPLKGLCSNIIGNHALSEKPHIPSESNPNCNESVSVEHAKNVCLKDKAHFKKGAIQLFEEKMSTPPTESKMETESQKEEMPDSDLSQRSHYQRHQETKWTERQENDKATEKEPFQQQSCSRKHEVTNIFEAVVAKEKNDLKTDQRTEEMDSCCCGIVSPFIGIDIPEEDSFHPHISPPQEVEQSPEEIPFICETTCPKTVLPSEVCSTSQICNDKAETCSFNLSLNETYQTEVFGSEINNRCPTPTLDEMPYEDVPYSYTGSSTATVSWTENGENNTPKPFIGSSSLVEKMSSQSNFSSTVNSASSLHHGLHSDLEERTQRVLQSIGKFLSESNQSYKTSELNIADSMGSSLHQTPKHSCNGITACLSASHTSQCYRVKSLNSEHPVMSTATSQDQHLESSDHLISPLKRRLEDTLGVELQSKQTNSSNTQHCLVRTDVQRYSLGQNHSTKSLHSDSLQLVKCSIDQTRTKLTSQSRLTHEPHPYAQCHVMAVKPSKSDESESFFSRSVESLDSVKHSPKVVDGNKGSLSPILIKEFEQKTKENIQMDHKDCSHASASFFDHKEDGIVDDDFIPRPQSSLECTFFNIGQEKSHPFLEQVSQRCLQNDVTQASMEQECLIFSEKMKQLLKKQKQGAICQQDRSDTVKVSCSSPVTICFSALEEQEDSLDYLDSSVVAQKIKVDLLDRKDLRDTMQEIKTLALQEPKTPLEHCGVSSVTAECTRLYEAKMQEICSVKKVQTWSHSFRRDLCNPKAEPSCHFDFCDQMKREMDETFRSKLNSVVKKSSKTRYRFYILVTSEDVFFEETKTQLEAEGHTAVQPSEFFLGENSSLILLIILRNEDIAEHICEIPHLLSLKKSPGVQFAGVDEPDDVVNLTHQELFTCGGFILFDRTVLESLSLCNMKKVPEILKELSRMGKWKWILHYRDSRQLKENARLSADAKEKKYFIDWAQDTGILEVLPYHECDMVSKDQPNYLTCLVRLQVQKISARFPVFVTDKSTDSNFEKNGILTLSLSSFLTKSPNEIFQV
ncbi:uncharacterized protein tasor2 isoform 2-T2 [Pholidichthys leucotaenia]